MLDALGERYGYLPSEVLSKATTMDLTIFDVAVAYKTKQIKKQSGDYDINDEYSQTELQDIMDKTRGSRND